MQQYNDIQTNYDSKLKERIVREVKIGTRLPTKLSVKPDVTPEELEAAIESKGPVFAGDMLDVQAALALQYSLFH